MKQRPKTKTLTAVLVFILSLALIQGACAKNESPSDTVEKKQKIEQCSPEQITEKRKEILAEATAAIRETQNALTALDRGQKKDALAALEKVSGKLTIILARDPELALAPAGVEMATYDILADVDDIKALRKKIESALDKGRIQEARQLIRNLASETVISITNIPLITYPDAIRETVKFIDDGKTDKARQVLQTALNTLVITETIIPLPISNAEALLTEAETLAEKTDRAEEDNNRLADLLKEARTELEFAQALGYGGKKDFKHLYEQLDVIKEKTKGGQAGTGFFDKIKRYLKDTVASCQQPKQPGNGK